MECNIFVRLVLHAVLYGFSTYTFKVQLDQQIERWRGNLDIGVTTFTPERSERPVTITDVTSGTWIVSGSSIITNGKVLKNDVVKPNLESLKVVEKYVF